ncbi:MAG: 4'-phosphopantetheinyl transferase superfamily protein [Candidatus Krumholzibacteriota bacterium]|nr:4'-phosphopantetheinyl transferase superfamily protein [Candidatus Krumholzibacteriota bacterium]
MTREEERNPAGDGIRPPGAVEVWFVDPSDAERLAAWEGHLSGDERARAARFRRDADRDVYVAAHGALRVILGRRIGVEPAQVRFFREETGRPVLDCGGPAFSISRTTGAALVAVSDEGPVGVDIELVAPRRLGDAVARRFFAPAELALLDGPPPGDRTTAFFRIWTRKEALVKALGTGLTAGLARIDASGAPRRAAAQGGPFEPLTGWILRTLALPAPYAGAVAAAGEDRAIAPVRAAIP